VFEVLASGALLLTSVPSELEQLGFVEGTHFVGYRRPEDIGSLVREYLADAASRARIANAARSLVLSEHTYDRRAGQLLMRLGAAAAKQAPARSWPETHARLAAMDFYAAHGLARCAASQFRRIAGHGFRETIEASALLSRAWIRSSRAS